MNDTYLNKIAILEEKTLESYKIDGDKTPDILVSSAILLCFLDGMHDVVLIAETIGEPPDRVKIVYDNLVESGYIKNNKVIFNIVQNTQEEWKREYYLFSISGLGVLKKI